MTTRFEETLLQLDDIFSAFDRIEFRLARVNSRIGVYRSVDKELLLQPKEPSAPMPAIPPVDDGELITAYQLRLSRMYEQMRRMDQLTADLMNEVIDQGSGGVPTSGRIGG